MEPVNHGPPRRRIGRALALAGIGVLGLSVLGLAGATVWFQGERLGRLVTANLPTFAGSLEVSAVSWRPRLLWDLVRDRPTPVVLEGVVIRDPEGTEVLRAPRIAVRVRPRSAIAGKVYLHDLELGAGSTWRFARMREQEGIGFLRWFRSAEPDPEPPAPDPPTEDAFVFQIVSARLDGLTAVFDFPGAWGLELRDIRAPATLLVEGPFVGFDIRDLDARGGGYLRVLDEVLPFDAVKVRRVATTRQWPDDIFLDVEAARTGASVLTARGRFTGIYGYGVPPGAPEPPSGIDMHAEIAQAADALSAVAARHAIEGLALGGADARVVLDLADAFESLRIAGELAALDVRHGSRVAQNFGVEFRLDLGEPMAIEVPRLGFESPGGGAVALEARLAGSLASARLSFTDFSTASYLPPALAELAAGILRGGLRLEGNLEARSLAVDELDLRLERRRAAGLPRKLRIFGRARANPDRASTRGITIEVPGARVMASGHFDLARRLMGVGLRATAANLPLLLRSLGLPPVARSADLALDVQGGLPLPGATGTASVRGLALGTLPPIGRVDARFGFESGVARLGALVVELFGGRVEASGSARLFGPSRAGRMPPLLRSPEITLEVQGRKLDLAEVAQALSSPGAGAPPISGRLDFDAHAAGPLDRISATLKVPPGTGLELFGERWVLDGLEARTDLAALEVTRARLERVAGGKVEITGKMGLAPPESLGFHIQVAEVPLAGLPGLADAGVDVQGRLFLDLAVSGTLDKPLLRGRLALADVSARGVALGDARIAFEPRPDGSGLDVTGDLFGRIAVTADVDYRPSGARVDARASFVDLVLEELLPEMASLGDARGRASGTVRFTFTPEDGPTTDVRLTALELSARRDLGDGTVSVPGGRLFLRNAGDLHLRMSGADIVVDRTRLVTDGGDFHLWGERRGGRLSGEVSGVLGLELVQPFLGESVESLAGEVAINLDIAGTEAEPRAEGTVNIARRVVVRLPGVAPALTVPSGKISVTPRAIRIADLEIESEGARLRLGGTVDLGVHQKIEKFDLAAQGELGAALVQAVAADVFSDAEGRAKISARLRGSPTSPRVEGRLDLGGLGFRLRDLGRGVQIERGTVELTNQAITLRGLVARVDGQGRLEIGARRPGRVEIARLFPNIELGAIVLPLSGRGLSFHASDAVELDDINLTLELTGSLQAGLELEGEVQVAAGRYAQDFTVRDLVITPSINESAARPFYQGISLLENLKLDLRLRTAGDSFVVRNNLAPEIYMAFDLLVRGTLSDPLISGEVRPTDGRFHIFGIQGDFTLVPGVNHITFVDSKSIDRGETPELNLEAESVVTDANSREHLVRMRITGPIGQAQIDLSTNTGLDRNETLRLFGSDLIGQISRDSVADFLEPYIDDTLQLLTGGKLNLRPTVGPDGFELRLSARAGRQFDFQLSLLRGLDDLRRYRAESSLWLMDYLTLRGSAEQLTFAPQQGFVEDTRFLKLETTLDFPIRPFLR